MTSSEAVPPPAAPAGEPPPGTGTPSGWARPITAAAAAVLILVTVWFLSILGERAEHRSELLQDDAEATRLVRLLDSFSDISIQRANRMAELAVRLVEAELAADERLLSSDSSILQSRLVPLIAEKLDHAPYGSTFILLGGDGKVLAAATISGRRALEDVILDAGMTERLLAGHGPEPLIGPATDLAGDGIPELLIGRRLRRPGGAVAGALVLGLSTKALDEFYRSTELRPYKTIELRGRSNVLLHRFVPEVADGQRRLTGSDPSAPHTATFEISARSPEAEFRSVMVIATEEHYREIGQALHREAVLGALISTALLVTVWILYRSQTKEVSAERRRRHSERKLLDAIDATNDVFVELDKDLRITTISRVFDAARGVSKADLVGIGIEELSDPSHEAEGSKAFRHAVSRRLPFRNVILPFVQPDGGEYWVRVSGKPVFDERGRFEGYRCMMADITDQEVRKVNEIHQARLSSLGQLAGGIAHDFNNLLAVILGFSSLLAEDLKDDPPRLTLIQRVIHSSERARDLVQHILSFARANPAPSGDVEIADAARTVAALLASSLPVSSQFTFEANARGRLVGIDKARLTDVLVNLCTNASDALNRENGFVRLTIEPLDRHDPTFRALSGAAAGGPDRYKIIRLDDRTHRVLIGRLDGSASYVHISISDTGAGIERDVLSRMFEPYFTTKPFGQRSGLGLSVVHGIVLAANGALSIATTVGKGTVVDVFLPVSEDGAGAPEQVVAADTGALGSILVVDDEQEVRDVIAMSLERFGMNVHRCGSGAEALSAFKASPAAWDAVLTDQGMPGMRGLELVRLIKAVRHDVPCIICTGRDDSMTETSALDAGADAYLRKPVTPDVLRTTVSGLIGAMRRGRPPEAGDLTTAAKEQG